MNDPLAVFIAYLSSQNPEKSSTTILTLNSQQILNI